MKFISVVLQSHDEQLILIGDERVYHLIWLVTDLNIMYQIWLLNVDDHNVIWSNAFEADIWHFKTEARKHWFLFNFHRYRIEIYTIFWDFLWFLINRKFHYCMSVSTITWSCDLNLSIVSFVSMLKYIMNLDSVPRFKPKLHFNTKLYPGVFWMKYFEIIIVLLTN